MEQNWEQEVQISWDQCMLREAIYRSIHPISKYQLLILVPELLLQVASRIREGECYLILTLQVVESILKSSFSKLANCLSEKALCCSDLWYIDVFAVNRECDKSVIHYSSTWQRL
jgi:hypothetical protein